MPRVAIVTGGRRGIGNGVCLALAKAGHDVLVVDLEEDEHVERTLAGIGEYGLRGAFHKADVGEISAHEGILDAASALGAPPCVLVNNAGVSSLVRGDLLELSPESFDRCIRINLRGAFFLSQCFAKVAMQGEGKHFRCIVNITSVNAEIVAKSRADYCISKAGLSMATKLLAARLAECNVHVYEVRPGMIRTEMTAPSAAQYDEFLNSGAVPIARWGEPADVGKAVAMLATGGLDYSTGNAISVDGGLIMYRL